MNTSELQGRYKIEEDVDVRERVLMVIWLMKGKTTYEVAELLNCPQSKVAYWKGKYGKEGIEGLKTKPRPGKPSALSKEEVKRIRGILEASEYWQTKWVSELIYRETNHTYSQRHVVRLLHFWGFEKIKPRKQHRLANLEEQKAFSKKREIYWGHLERTGR